MREKQTFLADDLKLSQHIDQYLDKAQEAIEIAFNTKKVKTAEDNELDEIFAPKRKW